MLPDIFYKIIMLPAIIKGMTVGERSIIYPGYDLFFIRFKNVILKKNVIIGKSAWISTINFGKLVVGNNTHIGRRVTIAAAKSIIIGDDCLISYDVSILDHDHDFISQKGKDNIGKSKKIIIGDNCFIGAHSFILKGVHLGNNCVVGANSVVTKSFSDYSVIVGNPAKLIRKKKN